MYLCKTVSSWVQSATSAYSCVYVAFILTPPPTSHTSAYHFYMFLDLQETQGKAENGAARGCPHLVPTHAASCAALSVLTKTQKRSGLMSCNVLCKREALVSSKLSTGILSRFSVRPGPYALGSTLSLLSPLLLTPLPVPSSNAEQWSLARKVRDSAQYRAGLH